MRLTRRRLLGAALLVPLDSLAQTCGALTLRQTEGPFYTPETPLRVSLLEGGEKSRLVLTGRVLSPRCEPLAKAMLDFWHADEEGEYDNRGFRYRGHQIADGEGRFRLETTVPGAYSGRTRHIHVKVQARGGPLLTTQLYFPGEPQNRRDGLYRKELEMNMASKGEARFDFVVPT